jgi:hypothetical protein
MNLKTKKLGIFAGVLILLAIAINSFIFPSWMETYSYKDDEIYVLPSHEETTPTPRLANSLVIRLTGKSRNECTWDKSARPDKTSLKMGHYTSRGINEVQTISSWLTNEFGQSPFPGYQQRAHGQKSLLGACHHGGAIAAIIYKPGYDTMIDTPLMNKTSNNRINLQRPGLAPNEPEVRRESRQLAAPMRLLFPFIGSALEKNEHAMTNDSTIKYWQHKLPTGNTVKDYAIMEIIRITSAVKNTKLKHNALILIKMLSKQAFTRNDIDEIYGFYRKITNEEYIS